MRDDFGESNVVVFTVTTVLIQAVNSADFLLFLEEPCQLREIGNEKPAHNGHRTRNGAFNNKNEAPSGIFACVDSR